MAKMLEADGMRTAEGARQLLFVLIKWGDHKSHKELRDLSEELVEANLKRDGYDFDGQIAELQKCANRAVSVFENFASNATYVVEGPADSEATFSVRYRGVEVSTTKIKGYGVVRQADLADFEAACIARDSAIRDRSIDAFYTAISKGFSSIEAYIALQVHIYNAQCTDLTKKLIENRKGGFVSLDEKIKKWMPIMSGTGIDIEKSPGWQDYKYLRKLRNDTVIHPKPGSGLTSLDELADGLNRFRSGIAGLSFFLRQAFNENVPSYIIRAAYYPEVHVVDR
jgi:hypothetical protein